MQLRSRVTTRQLLSSALYATVFFSIIAYGSYVFASSGGKTGATRKNGNGCNCHGPSASTAVTVSITGPAELSPGQVGNYTLTVQGGPAVRAGTNIAASAGVLNAGSGALQKMGDELTHSLPQSFVGGSATFPFTYTAPTTPGTYTIFANGNSVNFNGSTSGDQWNFAPDKVVTVKAATSVETSAASERQFLLAQNYPNPFNPSTNISYDVARPSHVQLAVYDLSGKLVRTLVDQAQSAGMHSVMFRADGLASGTYIYTMRVDGAVVQTRTMSLVK